MYFRASMKESFKIKYVSLGTYTCSMYIFSIHHVKECGCSSKLKYVGSCKVPVNYADKADNAV